MAYSPVLGDRSGFHENSEGPFGEQPEEGGDSLCRANGTAQQDSATAAVRAAVRAASDLGRGAVPDPRVYKALLNIRITLEAGIATH